jgi:single-strand DNA-binding protein
MNDFNTIILTGRLTRDPEQSASKDGLIITTFSIANNRQTKQDKQVSYFSCVTFGKTAEAVGQYCHKGDPVLISGSMQQSQYDKDGVTVKTYKITANTVQFLSSPKTAKEDAAGSNVKFGENPFNDSDMPF